MTDDWSREASTLRALAAAAKDEDDETWRSQGGRVLILALNALTASGAVHEVQEASILCIQEMILHHPSCVADYAEVVASKFFEVFARAGPDRKLTTSLARALDQLLASIDALRALEILLPQVSQNFGLLAAALRRLRSEQILEHLDIIVAPIIGAAESDSAEMRKAAIFSLVDLYLIVGE
ncbi:CLASP, partial [Symbiodinium pilosum]